MNNKNHSAKDLCHSEEWCLSKELAKQNYRLRFALAIVLVLWLVTIVGWGMCLVKSNAPSDTVSESLFLEESDGQTVYETEVS